MCIKHLDDPSAAVRQAAADALGESLVASLAHPFTTAVAGKGKAAGKAAPKLNKLFESKKADPTNAFEAVFGLLVAPFSQKSATRELRLGVVRAFVVFTRTLSRPGGCRRTCTCTRMPLAPARAYPLHLHMHARWSVCAHTPRLDTHYTHVPTRAHTPRDRCGYDHHHPSP